jgi:hypothetical protein
MTMSTKTRWTAAGVAAAAVAAWLLLSPPPAPSAASPQQHVPGGAVVAETAAPPLATADARTERTEVASPRVDGAATAAARGLLSGRVVDPDGAGVSPARVYALPMRDGRPHTDHVLRGQTDEQGRFALAPTFDGDAFVVAIPQRAIGGSTALAPHEALVAAAAEAAVHRERHTTIELRLAAAATLGGTVEERGTGPLASVLVGWCPIDTVWGLIVDGDFAVTRLPGGAVHVDVVRSAGGATFSGGTRTGADGRFAIPTVPGMRGYVFLVNQCCGEVERLVAERTATAPAHVVFELLPAACVRVTTGERPMASHPVDVELQLEPGAEPWREQYRTDANGELRVLRERIVPMRGRIQRPGREALSFDVPADATRASPLVVDLGTVPTAPVQVVLTTDRTVTALAAVLWRTDVRSAPIALAAVAPAPGASLTAMRADAPAGPYRLRVAPSPTAGGDDTFVLDQVRDVTVGATTPPIAVRIEHGGRIRVTVTTPDGQHAPGTVRLRDAGGKETLPTMHAPGHGNHGDGRLGRPGAMYTAWPLKPGRYEVIVDHAARGLHREFVDVQPCAFADVAVTVR